PTRPAAVRTPRTPRPPSSPCRRSPEPGPPRLGRGRSATTTSARAVSASPSRATPSPRNRSMSAKPHELGLFYRPRHRGVLPPGPGKRRLILITLSLALFMIFLDTTVVNIALPDIQRSLGGGIDQLQWVVDAYTVAFACFLLTAGVL